MLSGRNVRDRRLEVRCAPFLLVLGRNFDLRDADGWTVTAIASSQLLHVATMTTTIYLDPGPFLRCMNLLLDAADAGALAMIGDAACIYYQGVHVVPPPHPSTFGTAVACTPSEYFARMRRQFPANGAFRHDVDLIQARLCSLEAHAVLKLLDTLSGALRVCLPIVQLLPLIASYA
jgi:hypothetical protein